MPLQVVKSSLGQRRFIKTRCVYIGTCESVIRSENENSVGKINRIALAISESSFIEYLQEELANFLVRLVDFIKQDEESKASDE